MKISLMDQFKAGFVRGAGFVAGAIALGGISILVAQSLTTFSSGQVVSASAINANFTDLQNQITALDQKFAPADPAGVVAAFFLTACPTGWIPADGNNGTPDLRGRFVRGRDDFGTGAAGIDPDGVRAVGNDQGDSYRSHNHRETTLHRQGFDNTSFINNGLVFVANQFGQVAIFENPGNAHNTFTFTSGGPETRPRNVSLIFCMRRR